MRFLQNDAPKWGRKAVLKNRPAGGNVDLVHHNTLNGSVAERDAAARSREVEKFFDLMTSAKPQVNRS